MSIQKVFLALVLFLFGVSSLAPVAAFEARQGESVTVPKGTTIQGSLAVAGNAITIDGTVNGDLYCGGQTIVVRGNVNGDIICAGQTLTVSGTVSGNIRAAGQLIEVAGPVKRNITAAGQTITITPGAVISGEVLAAGKTVILGEGVRITGDLTYMSVGELTEATGAAVGGKITHFVPKKDDWKKPVVKRDWMPRQKPWPTNAVGSIIFYLIVGAIAVLIGPTYAVRVTEKIQRRPFVAGFIGFLSFLVVPMVVIMMAMTLIGIPLAMIVGFIFGLMLLMSRVYVSLIAGEKTVAFFGRKKPQLLTQILVGVPVLWLLFKVPVLGWALSLLALFWGMGGIVLALGKR